MAKSSNYDRKNATPKKASGTPGTKFKHRILNYNPTEEQKKEIINSELSAIDALDGIVSRLPDGLILSLTFDLQRGSFCLMLRETGDDWRENKAVSFWHSDLHRVLAIADYAFANDLKNWPAEHELDGIGSVDW